MIDVLMAFKVEIYADYFKKQYQLHISGRIDD